MTFSVNVFSSTDINRTVHVSHLPSFITEQHLIDLFAPCGPISYIRVLGEESPQATNSKFAFVEFLEPGGFNAAFNLSGMVIGDKQIQVCRSHNGCAKPLPKTTPDAKNRLKALLDMIGQKVERMPSPTPAVIGEQLPEVPEPRPRRRDASKERDKDKSRRKRSRDRGKDKDRDREGGGDRKRSRERSRKRARGSRERPKDRRRSRDRREGSRERSKKDKDRAASKDRKKDREDSAHGQEAPRRSRSAGSHGSREP